MARYGWRVLIGVVLVAALALLVARSGERGPGVERAGKRAAPAAASESLEPEAPERIDPDGDAPAERVPDVAVSSEARARASAIVLTVVDVQRSPLAGARVRFELGEQREERVTDALGTCTWERPAAGAVLVEREGYAHRRLRSVAGSLTIVLHQAARLEGRVLDAATKTPLAGAVVERDHTGCVGCAPDRVESGADGRYALEGLPAGTPEAPLVFFVRAAEHAGQRFEFMLWQAVPRVERDFELEARPELYGTVQDLATGAPIAGARIAIGIDVLASDPEGRFSTATSARLDEPAQRGPARHLSVRAPGYCVLSAELDGLESPAAFRLPRSAVVAGRVRDAAGAPVPAHLGLSNAWEFSEHDPGGTPYGSLPASWRISGASRPSLAGADGRFRIEGVLPWCDANTLWVRGDGYPERELALSPLLPEQVLELDVVLERPAHGTITGQLLLNGRAVRGNVSWHSGPEFGGVDGRVEAAEGRYRLEDVPAGPVRLEAFPLGMSVAELAPGSRVELVLAAGQELVHDFLLDVPLSPISGHVRHEDGSPAVNVEVSASAGSGPRTGRTDRAGAYRLLVPAGASAYTVSAREESVLRSREGVAPGTEGVDFVLPRLGTLLLRVVDRETRARVLPVGPCWRPAGRGEYERFALKTPDEQGFSLARLPAGAVDLFVYAGQAGHAPGARLDVPVRADGEPERVTFELERGLELHLRADPPARLPGWTVLAPAELWSALTCTRNERGNNLLSFGGLAPANGLEGLFQSQDGECLVPGLAPGRYRFKTFHEDLVLEPEVLELSESPAEPIVVRWRRR